MNNISSWVVLGLLGLLASLAFFYVAVEINDLFGPPAQPPTREQVVEAIIRGIYRAERPSSLDSQHDNMIETYRLMYSNRISSAEIIDVIRTRDIEMANHLVKQGF